MPVAHLTHRALISVTGTDARPFLHGLLTQNIESLGDGDVRFGALLGPQGRLLFDLFLFGEAEAVLLDCAASRREALVARLNLYRLRADVQIALDPRPVFAAWDGAAPRAPEDSRRSDLGRRTIAPLAEDACANAWRRHCLDQGVPDSEDFAFDADYPIECNLDLMNGIDFHKGCFIGQEVTSRMKRRGKVKSRLIPIRFEGAALVSGTEILNGDRRAGEVRGGITGQGMAMMRLDRAVGDLTADGRVVQADLPDWLDISR